MSDQAIFWLGFKVFAWKRFITVMQWMFAAFGLYNLVDRKHKRLIHSWLVGLRERTKTTVVPPVVKLRTLLGYGSLSVIVMAGGAAGLLNLVFTHNGKPIPFWPTFFPVALLLSMFAVIAGEIIFVLSLLRSSVRGVQRHGPPVLAWLLDYRNANRNVTVLIFIMLTVLTVVQLILI